ncbi:hypothetical protein EMCRGX_G007898 [Ephydatia muelleri]
MPSRNQKKRSKQRAEYLQKREDILSQENKAKARARYKADPEKKKASVATPTTQMLYLSVLLKGSDIKRASRRTVLLKGSDIKRASRRTVLLKGSDIKRASRRTVLLKGSDIKRASRRTVLLKGGYTGAIQLPLRQLEGVGIGRVVELPLPPKAQKVVIRSACAAVSKISADALLAKALSVRRSQAGSLLKTLRKVNAKKLQESDILVRHRFHTAGAEPYFFDNSYTHTKQHGAIPVDLNGRCVVAEEIKDRDKGYMAEEVGKEFFDDSEGEEVEEAHTSSFITTSAPASASLTTSSSAAPASASPTTSSSAAPANSSPTISSSAAPANASPTTSSSAAPASASPTISSSAAPASASPTAAPTKLVPPPPAAPLPPPVPVLPPPLLPPMLPPPFFLPPPPAWPY